MFPSGKMRRVPSMRSYKLATHYQQNNYTYWYRLRALSFYLVVFALGCAFSAYLLSLGPQAQLERTTAVTKLSVLVTNPEGGAQTATLSRRGLYTSNTGGERRAHPHISAYQAPRSLRTPAAVFVLWSWWLHAVGGLG